MDTIVCTWVQDAPAPRRRWEPIHPTDVSPGSVVRWIEMNWSTDYRERSASGERAILAEVVKVTSTGLRLKVMGSVGADALSADAKPILRRFASLAFHTFEEFNGADDPAKGLEAWLLGRS